MTEPSFRKWKLGIYPKRPLLLGHLFLRIIDFYMGFRNLSTLYHFPYLFWNILQSLEDLKAEPGNKPLVTKCWSLLYQSNFFPDLKRVFFPWD